MRQKASKNLHRTFSRQAGRPTLTTDKNAVPYLAMPRLQPPVRNGFTLLEMLIATGIFLFGFMAVYALFLIGVESRQKAEQITRTSLAADAMLEDWRLRFSGPTAAKNQKPSSVTASH